MKNTPPIHSTPAAHPLHHPSYRCHQLMVDCCILGSIADTVNANGVFVIVVGDVAVLAVLVVVVFVDLSLPSRSPNVLAWSRGLSHPPSAMPTCFWLVVAWQNIEPQPSKAFVVLYFCILFLSFNLPPRTKKTPPPYTPPRPRILSIIPPIAAAN
jgi:hypothetical protein